MSEASFNFHDEIVFEWNPIAWGAACSISQAAGKKAAAAQKKAGKGLFAVKTLSADLAAICGKNKMSRPEAVKAIWAYIKKNKLNKGRTITPDAKLKRGFGRYSNSQNPTQCKAIEEKKTIEGRGIAMLPLRTSTLEAWIEIVNLCLLQSLENRDSVSRSPSELRLCLKTLDLKMLCSGTSRRTS